MEDWHGGTPNYGMMLYATNEDVESYDVRFYSSESDTSSNDRRPKLEITYTREFVKNFYLKDHLGNIRVTIDEEGEVVGYNDYYPFGLQMPGRSYNSGLAEDIYKFSSKELDEENELDWYYFGARYYDPGIGRWLNVDPVNQDSSPYIYCANNPLIFIDPNGLEWYLVTEEHEEEVEDEDGNKTTVKKTRKNWKYYADTKEKEIWTGEYNSGGSKGKVITQGIGELLSFDGSNLSWLQADGGIQSWAAVSGVLDAFGNTQPGLQDAKDQGPIPEGWYLVDLSQTLAEKKCRKFLGFYEMDGKMARLGYVSNTNICHGWHTNL